MVIADVLQGIGNGLDKIVLLNGGHSLLLKQGDNFTLSTGKNRYTANVTCLEISHEQVPRPGDRMQQTHYRACPLCEAICGLEFQMENGELKAIRGDDHDPFSRGHICPKGNAILDLETDPDRLRQPMRRVGQEWQPIEWDEAFDIAGRQLARTQQEYGANAVAAYLGNPNTHHFGHIAYLPALLKLIRTQNVYSASSVDQWPHQFVNYHLYGHQWLLPVPDIDHTDYFLMIGANPIASNGSLMTVPDVRERIKALTNRGKLVVIDPRRTETAALASEHHFIKPASDAFFLIALLQALQKTGEAKIQAYAGKLNDWDKAIQAIAAFDCIEVENITGISARTIKRIADELYQAKTAVAYGRMGVSVQAHGSLCQWLIHLINIYTGNLDRIGGALVNEPAIPLTGPDTSKGAFSRWRSRVRGLAEFVGELPVSALLEEIQTPGEGQIRALFTSAGNPVLSTPNGNQLHDALKDLDFMLSIDVYINETTQHAHLILPPASALTQYHYDNIFNAFAVQRVARLNKPLREQSAKERADWQIINGIAAAYARYSEKQWKPLPDIKTMIGLGLSRGTTGLSVQDLEQAEHGMLIGPLRPSLLQRLETTSGCIEAAPELFLQALNNLQRTKTQAPFLLFGRRDIRSNNSWMHNAPRLIKGKPRHQAMMHPDDLQALNIVSDSLILIRSTSGEIKTEVVASNDVMRGSVCLPHGFGHQHNPQSRASTISGASYNDISDGRLLDSLCGNAALNGVPIWVEAVNEC